MKTHEHLLVECPSCKSMAKRCKRPSGHDAAEWHLVREDALAQACACDEVCKGWTQLRKGATP